MKAALIKSLHLIPFVLLLSASATALAATDPLSTVFDKRIQNVIYNPDDVVVVRVSKGISTLIQLEAGEFIDNNPEGGLSMGDIGAWTLGVRGNNIFLKPKADFPDTNINIVSNKRTYSVWLKTAPNPSAVTHIVRFVYPAPIKPYKAPVVDRGPCSDGPQNNNYFMWGDKELAPTMAWDDGRFTCFKYPSSTAIPAIYRRITKGALKESLVNFHIHNDIVVVHEVTPEFRFRIGETVLGVKTDSLVYAPFNHKQTTIKNEKRVIKNVE